MQGLHDGVMSSFQTTCVPLAMLKAMSHKRIRRSQDGCEDGFESVPAALLNSIGGLTEEQAKYLMSLWAGKMTW
jgi:hypothetical protein